MAHLKMRIVGNVAGEDVDVGSALQVGIGGYLFIRGGFVADEAEDDAVGLAGVLSDELVLERLAVDACGSGIDVCRSRVRTPIPLEAPVIT